MLETVGAGALDGPAAQVFVFAWGFGEKDQSSKSVILSDQRESKDLGSIDDA